MAQIALNIINDCLRTDLCLRFKPNIIAVGAIYVAVNLAPHELSTRATNLPDWWTVFGVTKEDLTSMIPLMKGRDYD